MDMRAVLSPFSDPFINLAIESVLFKHKPAAQNLLFVYFNSPCVVIGRNQNPWAECNLCAGTSVLRRRSGGGTVVHSLGNANFCVQNARTEFSRTKYLKMVCAAFPDLGLEINKRHDLVLNGKKVSGSSYKIERDKAYHHATFLLDADLKQLSGLLAVPPCQGNVMTSGATESVRSPVTNTGLSRYQFVRGIFQEFFKWENYTPPEKSRDLGIPAGVKLAQVSGEVLKDAEELKSWDWVFGKTPKFEIEWDHKHLLVEKGRIASGWPEMHGQPLPHSVSM